MTSLPPPAAAPPWPHCAEGAGPDDPIGCRGHRIEPQGRCLSHLTSDERTAYFGGLGSGSTVDHRGTELDAPLLEQLLDALRDPSTGDARLGFSRFESATFKGIARFGSAVFEGDARFGSAVFEGDARFGSAVFEGDARFGSATFKGIARFESAVFEGIARFESAVFEGIARFESAVFERGAWFMSATFKGHAGFGSTFKGIALFGSATFEGDAWFQSVVFEDDAAFGSAVFEGDAEFWWAVVEGGAWFGSAVFEGDARFGSATFKGDAGFGSATFEGGAWFMSARFKGDARFGSATFKRNASFDSATFELVTSLGPLVGAGRVTLSGAVFGVPVTIMIAARRLVCRRTRWSSTASLQLRYATVDFAHAVFEYPLTIAAEPDLFLCSDGTPVNEQVRTAASDATVRMASLRGVDAAHLVLADVDLSRCLFTGTIHLDQLRLEGTCSFDAVPPRTHWRRGRPMRFTQRRTLAEEQHWRAGRGTAVRGWNTAVIGAGQVGPAQLAPVYRALRKSFEDSKNEPGAADFYYGEMEMRRHDSGTPRAERGLLTAYWALSGYGLRATRTLVWLLLAMTATLLAMMLWGLAVDDPKPVSSGKMTGQDIRLTTDTPDPVNPTGPLHERISAERFEKGLRVVINSVVFRSSGQDLTTVGTYTEMLSRLTEPVLLGLAVLAVRSRVKR